MSATSRPEYATVAVWDRLDKIAQDYRALEKRCTTWRSSVVDRRFIARTAEQLTAARDQVSEGSIDTAVAVAVMQAAERMFPLARDLVKARS